MTAPILRNPTGAHRPTVGLKCTCSLRFSDEAALWMHIGQQERRWRMRRNQLLQVEPDGKLVPRVLLTELLLAVPEALWRSRETFPLGSPRLSKCGPVRLLSESEVSESSLLTLSSYCNSSNELLHLVQYKNFRKTCRLVTRAMLGLSGGCHRRMKGA